MKNVYQNSILQYFIKQKIYIKLPFVGTIIIVLIIFIIFIFIFGTNGMMCAFRLQYTTIQTMWYANCLYTCVHTLDFICGYVIVWRILFFIIIFLCVLSV